MSDFSRIPANSGDEVTIEPVEAKTFPDKYVIGLHMSRKPGELHPVTFAFQPFNYDTGEVNENSELTKRLKLRDIRQEIQRSSLFSQIMTGLNRYAGLLYREVFLKRALMRTPEGDKRDDLLSAFTIVQNQLGIDPPEDPPDYVEDQSIWLKPDGNKG